LALATPTRGEARLSHAISGSRQVSEVDAFVLDMIERRTCHKVEFTETSDARVLRSPFTHDLTGTVPQGPSTRPDR
jgi:hypothetical protein